VSVFYKNPGCDGKTRYSENVGWHIAKKFQSQGDQAHAYHCKECGAWHVGYNRVTARKTRNQ